MERAAHPDGRGFPDEAARTQPSTLKFGGRGPGRGMSTDPELTGIEEQAQPTNIEIWGAAAGGMSTDPELTHNIEKGGGQGQLSKIRLSPCMPIHSKIDCGAAAASSS